MPKDKEPLPEATPEEREEFLAHEDVLRNHAKVATANGYPGIGLKLIEMANLVKNLKHRLAKEKDYLIPKTKGSK